jgi:uncharacterized protein (TIGR03578 family)
MFQEMEYTLIVTGTDETKRDAFQQVLTRMKTQIAKEIPDILLQIIPQNIEVLTATQTSYKEKFLGLLFPRVRTRYEITAKVTVTLRIVKLSEVAFTELPEQLPVFKRILKMR